MRWRFPALLALALLPARSSCARERARAALLRTRGGQWRDGPPSGWTPPPGQPAPPPHGQQPPQAPPPYQQPTPGQPPAYGQPQQAPLSYQQPQPGGPPPGQPGGPPQHPQHPPQQYGGAHVPADGMPPHPQPPPGWGGPARAAPYRQPPPRPDLVRVGTRPGPAGVPAALDRSALPTLTTSQARAAQRFLPSISAIPSVHLGDSFRPSRRLSRRFLNLGDTIPSISAISSSRRFLF